MEKKGSSSSRFYFSWNHSFSTPSFTNIPFSYQNIWKVIILLGKENSSSEQQQHNSFKKFLLLWKSEIKGEIVGFYFIDQRHNNTTYVSMWQATKQPLRKTLHVLFMAYVPLTNSEWLYKFEDCTSLNDGYFLSRHILESFFLTMIKEVYEWGKTLKVRLSRLSISIRVFHLKFVKNMLH